MPPRAVYTASVVRLAPVNCRDVNTSSGSIGFGVRASVRTNAPRATTPRTAAASSTGPKLDGALDEGVRDAGEADGDEQRSRHVDVADRVGVAALGDVAQRDRDRDRGEGEVDEEHEPPRDRVDQPAAEERAERSGDAGQARPCADGPAPVVGVERRRDDGQAARHEERGGRSLQGAGGDEEAACSARGRRGPTRP